MLTGTGEDARELGIGSWSCDDDDRTVACPAAADVCAERDCIEQSQSPQFSAIAPDAERD